MKPPRFLTVFEALVNGFACQQLSLVVGLELLNRLAVVCDVGRGSGLRSRYGFPTPDDVARHHAGDYRAIGFSRQKVHALLTLALGIHDGGIAVEELERYNDAEVCARLCELRGVGRWTAKTLGCDVHAAFTALLKAGVTRRIEAGKHDNRPRIASTELHPTKLSALTMS
jgi:DNA-3-methyladenine glycosylase II